MSLCHELVLEDSLRVKGLCLLMFMVERPVTRLRKETVEQSTIERGMELDPADWGWDQILFCRYIFNASWQVSHVLGAGS